MITPNMTDDQKRTALMNMTYEDLEAEIISGRLTWQEFDRLLPEIGAAIGATVMFENSTAPKASMQLGDRLQRKSRRYTAYPRRRNRKIRPTMSYSWARRTVYSIVRQKLSLT